MARSVASKSFNMPVGRMLGGSLYTAKTKDADGKALTVKTGQNAGQPTQRFDFAVGYPKTPGVQHWAHEPIWGAIIWAVGNACFPKVAEGTEFSWKITDGDSTKKNKKGLGVAPNTLEGYPGHWVIWFSSTYAPKIVNADGSAYLLEKDTVMPGDFIQVGVTCDGNASTQNPGVYLNHDVVRFLGYSVDGRITSAGDALNHEWEPVALPAKLSQTPVTAAAAPTPAPMSGPAPALPGAAPALGAPTGIPLPITPAPGFLQPQPSAPLPAPPGTALPPPPPRRPMSAKANGHTYEQLLGGGWTDESLAAHGMFA